MSEINSKKRISINIISSITQVLVVGIVYLLLYRFLLVSLGVEQLGIWSIVLATTSIASLANFGITSGLIKFIAEYNARGKLEDISKLIFTSFVSIFAFFAIIIFLLFAFSKFLLGFVIEPNYFNAAYQIVPYSLLCLFINSIGGVFTSTLEGFQKNYIKNYIVVFSTVLLLISSYFLVPIFHLKGVAIAQVLQAVVLLIGSFLSLNKVFKNKIFNQWNWDKLIFKELLSFGLKFQIISVFQMLYEPITKGLISKFGGLAFLGYYEMAARLVNQIRAIIVNSNQVMIPVVAHKAQEDTDELGELYKKTFSIVFFVDCLLTTLLIVFTPIISVLWIGKLEPTFIFAVLILSTAMFVNILNGPAYFSCVGKGKLNLVLTSQIMIGVLNLIFGLLGGYFYGGNGVIIGWGLALVFSSLFLIITYQKENTISFDFLLIKSNLIHFCTSLLIAFSCITFYELLIQLMGRFWIVFGFFSTVAFGYFIVFSASNISVKNLFNKLISFKK